MNNDTNYLLTESTVFVFNPTFVRHNDVPFAVDIANFRVSLDPTRPNLYNVVNRVEHTLLVCDAEYVATEFGSHTLESVDATIPFYAIS